uniref:Uncharacterized protein n=1 Tax=Ditylenchus dipsaci TaxID=166011 RepID=A0A915EPK6_9BILA
MSDRSETSCVDRFDRLEEAIRSLATKEQIQKIEQSITEIKRSVRTGHTGLKDKPNSSMDLVETVEIRKSFQFSFKASEFGDTKPYQLESPFSEIAGEKCCHYPIDLYMFNIDSYEAKSRQSAKVFLPSRDTLKKRIDERLNGAKEEVVSKLELLKLHGGGITLDFAKKGVKHDFVPSCSPVEAGSKKTSRFVQELVSQELSELRISRHELGIMKRCFLVFLFLRGFYLDGSHHQPRVSGLSKNSDASLGVSPGLDFSRQELRH